MNSERSQAYGRVMLAIEHDGLTPQERAQLREAADILLFCDHEALSSEARDAFAQAGELAGRVVGEGRWSAEQVKAALRDLEGCGPMALASSR
jgi:hypothetical protein